MYCFVIFKFPQLLMKKGLIIIPIVGRKIMSELSRDIIIERLYEDLVGPHQPDEVLESKPSDVYLQSSI